jgi:predicted O-methyltransferase YrrM
MVDAVGFLTHEEGIKLAELAQRKVCAELGSFKGRSACYIAPVAISLLCVDTFKAANDGKLGEGQRQVERVTTLDTFKTNTKHFSNIAVFIGEAADAAAKQSTAFDFVFVDADHSYEGVLRDIELWWPLLKSNGIMALHDYGGHWKGVTQAVDEKFVIEGRVGSLVWTTKNT